MAFIISLGKYNIKYNYILFAVFFQIVYKISYIMTYDKIFTKLRFFPSDVQSNYFSKHDIIHNIFCNFGIFIMSIIFYIYEREKFKQESESNNNKNNENRTKENRNPFSIVYLKAKNIPSIPTFYSLLIITILVISDQFLIKFLTIINNVDFWMIEIIIMTYLYHRLHKVEIYNYQKLALGLNLFPIIFKALTIYISFLIDKGFYADNKYINSKGSGKSLYVVYWYLLPIGILIHLIFATFRSYSLIKIRKLMDLKYISVNKLLILYGFFGTLFNIIICTIATFSKCRNHDEKINITDYFCKIKEPKTNNTYYDSFDIYFHTTNEIREIIIEIIVEILASICLFSYKYCSMMIIKDLSPIHLIFLLPFGYLLRKIIHIIVDIIIFIFTKGKKELFNFSIQPYLREKFILNINADIFSFIVFLIYLEIIELNFCNFNYNLRKKIISRSQDDFKKADSNELLQILPEEEEEEEEN